LDWISQTWEKRVDEDIQRDTLSGLEYLR